MTTYTYWAPVTGTWAPAPGRTDFHAGRGKYNPRTQTWSRLHSGNDLVAANGSNVLASIGGTILFLGHIQGYGANVVVLGDDGNVFRYAMHASYDPSLQVGSRVEQGGVLGKVGEHHVHIEVVPPSSPAYSALIDPKNLGKFVETQSYAGKADPTIDPAKFFGAYRGEAITAGQPIGDPQRQEIVQNKAYPSIDPLQAKLAGVMLSEARGLGPDALRHVGQVAMNRVDDRTDRFPSTLDGVLSARNAFAKPITPAQLRPAERALWGPAYDMAGQIMRRELPDTTNGAVFFATPKAAQSNPDFRRIVATNAFDVADSGHLFYGTMVKAPIAPTTDQFAGYLKALEGGNPALMQQLYNPRMLAEANWAAEAQSPLNVAAAEPATSALAPEPAAAPAADAAAAIAQGQSPPQAPTPVGHFQPPPSRMAYSPGFAGPTIDLTGTPGLDATAEPPPEAPAAPPAPPVPVAQPASPPPAAPAPDLSAAVVAPATSVPQPRMRPSFDFSKTPVQRFTRAMIGGDPQEIQRSLDDLHVLKPDKTPNMFTAGIVAPQIKAIYDGLDSGQRAAVNANTEENANLFGKTLMGAFTDMAANAPPAKDRNYNEGMLAVSGGSEPGAAYHPDLNLGYSETDRNAVTDATYSTPRGDPGHNLFSPSPLSVSPTPAAAAPTPTLSQNDIAVALNLGNISSNFGGAYGSPDTSEASSADPENAGAGGTPAFKATPAAASPASTPKVSRAATPQRPPAAGAAPQVTSGGRAGAVRTNGSSGNALLAAAGGGHLETTPLGSNIAVNTHDDGGVTTSYHASDGHIITIHTDANGDTNTVSG